MSAFRSCLMSCSVAFGALLMLPSSAEACGCFTPPDPTVPIVQAGERILFAVKDGQVTSHVQIQYSGDAKDFGWLLPLPAVPTLELSTDELFTQLYAATQPEYRMTTLYDKGCYPQYAGGTGGGSGGFGGAGGGNSGSADAGAASPLVVQDSIGPYDYAVLRADSKDAMLGWLADNRYFVPVGTTDSVAPYIHPGAFFLALKLHSGNSTGDLQPVVLKYASDVGMIPIILTSTGAAQNMGVQVWMLGQGRAIPRNYFHTVINDAAIDWVRAGSNYNSVIIRAVGEAPTRHTFVTEYAGSSQVMRSRLAPPGRFGLLSQLAAQPTASAFLHYLYANGFSVPSPRGFYSPAPLLSAQLKAILTKFLPPPTGVSADQYYSGFDYYPSQATANYQPVQMAGDIWSRVVEPTRAAAALFEALPTLTRLYTTISPEDMTRDPVFAFNPSLPDVSNLHQATMQVSCDSSYYGVETTAVLRTEQGSHLNFPHGRFNAPQLDPGSALASWRIEILREEGAPIVAIDNTAAIHPPGMNPPGTPPNGTTPPGGTPPGNRTQPPTGQGCDATGGPAIFALGLAALALRRRRGGLDGR